MMNTHEVTTNTEEGLDRALRPTTFKDFLGQEDSKANLEVYVKAALSRGEALDHILLAGPPGLGKTTLAGILAAEMGAKLVVVNAPSIKTKGELASVLASLRKGDILFLDEIHSLNNRVEEVLYPAMEDFKLEVVAGNQPLTINLEPFTLIGATTRAGMLQRPLRDRFGVTIEMQLYTEEELAQIATNSAEKLGMVCTDRGAQELARRARGTPRVANRILRRVRDFAQVRVTQIIDHNLVEFTCDRLGIDSIGLDVNSQRYLRVLSEKNQPVALTTLVSLLGESKDTIEEVIEPNLMRLGLVEKTPKGRIITRAGNAHLLGEQ
jgi:Holliday junction DNA helicase RuvB